MEKIVILANRLAESILMNWDEEEVIKLAKEVAVACHENIEFISLVKKMREAQAEQEIISARLMYVREHKGVLTDKDFLDVASITDKVVNLESEVDEYLKKIGS